MVIFFLIFKFFSSVFQVIFIAKLFFIGISVFLLQSLIIIFQRFLNNFLKRLSFSSLEYFFMLQQ